MAIGLNGSTPATPAASSSSGAASLSTSAVAAASARFGSGGAEPAAGGGGVGGLARVRALDGATINPRIRDAKYAVRGELPRRAARLKEQLATGGPEAAALPFDEIVFCNIGNPQALGNPAFTYHRQVLALCDYPELMRDERAASLFPSDAREAAQRILDSCGLGGTGAYSGSQGVQVVREDVARFINARDGTPGVASADDVFLSNGSSGAIVMLTALMATDASVGMLIPVPQYPIYSALLTVLGAQQLHYHLREPQQWSIDVGELEQRVRESRARGVDPRGLVVISPGNPTGQVLPVENMREVLAFAHRERLMLLADEVYAENVYAEGREFHSFRKVLYRDMPAEAQRELELASLHSASKGVVGECGRRGGYVHLSPGFTQEMREQLLKLASIMLCPNLSGQVMMDCVVRPPAPGAPSHELFERERSGRYESLKRRAKRVAEAFRAMDGVTCNESEGAMYAFPQIRMSERAVQAAKAAGMAPDTFYCVSLLERTGICVVPGAGFGMQTGEADGRFYFRTTILPPEDKTEAVIARMKQHHEEFTNKFA